MPSTTTYNCLNIGAGLIKANIFALDNLNPSVTAPQQAKITVTINAASPFTADIYKQPSADVDAATEATYKLFQQSFTVGTNVFDVDITDMFSKTSEAETYIRVAPVNAATFDISGKVIITADTTRPSNIVKRTLPTEAQLSLDVGDIGTASVNLRDGSLSFSHADWVLGGGKTAFSLIHTYNSARCDSDEIFSDIHSFAGKGWKTNFHQYLAGKDKFASYIDTSGNEHFFAESGGKIYDKSGLGLYLDASGNCKELYDESGNILRFSPGGMLCCVESDIGNDFYIGYEESGTPVGDTVNNTGFTLDGDRVTRLQDNDRVVLFGYADELQNHTAYSDTRNDVTFSYADNTLTLTDGEPSANEITVSHEASQVPINGDILTNVRIAFIQQGDKTIPFAYTNNLLSSVVHPDVSEQLRFSYSDGRLTKISKVIGQDESVQAQFAYNADGKLCRVYGDDYAQLYISYNQNGMVSSVSRSADNSPGTTIDYSSGATVVTNELGAKTRYTLSDNGDIMTIHNITDGCEEQLYPETNTSARVISSATFIGGNNINSIVGVTVNSESIPFGQGEFTIKDLRTTLGNIAKNNSSFDFVYDKGRKKICGVNSTSCRLNTSSSSFSIVSGGMPLSIDYETTVKDVTQSNTIKITVTETFAADYIQSVTTACDAKTNTVYPSYTKTVKSRYDGKTLSVLENNLLTEYTYDSYGNITQTKARKNGTTSPNIITSAVYDETNGNKTRETDANGFATTYTYLMPHNLVSSISKPTGSVTYTYDAFKENLVSANGASVTMDKKKIKAISKSNLNYNFEYSEQGDLTAVTEGSSTITSRSVSYTAGGKTVADTVGGTSVSTVYNKYGKPSSVSVGTKSASIQYTDATSKAKVAKIIDNISGVTTTYSTSDYDESAFTCSGALAWSKKAYIKNGKVFSAYNINGDSEEIAYFKEQFDRNGKTVSVVNVTPNYNTEANTVVCESQADDLGRMNKISCSSPNGTFSYRSRLDNTFEYKLLTNGNNSRLVQKETVAYKPETSTAASTAATRTYTYDSAGNVTKITTNNGSVTYTYAGGRLTHESNGLTGQNVSYEYDSFGNITKKNRDRHRRRDPHIFLRLKLARPLEITFGKWYNTRKYFLHKLLPFFRKRQPRNMGTRSCQNLQHGQKHYVDGEEYS